MISLSVEMTEKLLQTQTKKLFGESYEYKTLKQLNDFAFKKINFLKKKYLNDNSCILILGVMITFKSN